MDRDQRRRTKQEVTRLCASGLDVPTLFSRSWQAVGKAVPYDHMCCHTADPATLLMTSTFEEHLGAEPRLPRHEYVIPDVNKWSYLAGQSWPVGLLSQATRGYPESSPRYRELMHPRGIADELRASICANGQCWGFCGIYRDRGRPDFTEDEAALVAELTTVLAGGIRRALLLGATARDDQAETGPGLVIFDRAGDLSAVNAAGTELLAAFMGQPSQAVPNTILAMAERTRLAASGEPTGPTWTRARTRDGRWFMLHGTRLGDGPDAFTAVIIEPARPAELAELIVLAYGLTAREREVVRQVAAGESTARIATSLHLSPFTVQDHLKAIFDKVGVHSRRELIARIFQDHYWPRVVEGEPLGADGWFAEHHTPEALSAGVR